MPAGVFDLTVFNDKRIADAMARLPIKVQVKIMRTACRRSTNRFKDFILLNASGEVIDEMTGRLVNALEAGTVHSKLTRNGAVVVMYQLPSRVELGIPRTPADTEYYPTILEYGSPKAAPRPYIRSAVDRASPGELERMGAYLGVRAAAEWARLTKMVA